MPKKSAAGGGNERPKPTPPDKMTFTSINDLQDKQKGPEIDRRLKAFAIAITKDTTFAKDVVSITYEKAIGAARRGLFEEGTQLMSWLYRIAQNTWYDQIRAMEVQEFVVEPFDEDATDAHDRGRLGVTDSHQHRELESRRQLEIVRAAIESLPPEQRELIELVADEVSYKDMAEIQGVPIGTVMSRLSRARKTLRERTGYGSDEPEER